MTVFTVASLNEKSKEKPWGYRRDVLRLAKQFHGGHLMLSMEDFNSLRAKYGNRTSLRFKVRSFWRHLWLNIESLWLNRKVMAAKSVAKSRYAVCALCSELSKTGFCGVCGCNMQLKTKLIYAECPLSKW